MKKVISTLFFLYAVVAFSQETTMDSLQKLLNKSSTADQKINLYLKLFSEMSPRDIDSSFAYLKNARSVFNEKVADSIKQDFYRRYAEYFLKKNQYDSVLIYANKGLQIKNANQINVIDIYSMQGTAYFNFGNYEKALESHLRANRISDSLNLKAGKARVYNNIGITFMKLEDWDKAEGYMTRSYDICKRDAIKNGMSYTLGNLGIIYKHQNKFDKAIAMYRTSLEINKELNDLVAISRNYNNIGSLYEEKGELNLALTNYDEALNYSSLIKNEFSLTLGYHNKASVLVKMGKLTEAELFYKNAEKLASRLKLKDILKEIYSGMSDLYEHQGNYKNALMAHKNYEMWKDSVISTEHLSAISELEIKYETEKKEKDILALSAQKLRDEAAISKQQTLIKRLIYGFLTIFLVLFSGFIIYKQYISNKKKQELINVINSTQTEERTRIARDLHDSVGGSMALIKNKLRAVFSNTSPKPEEVMEILETVTVTGDQVRQIAHNLMPGELVRFGLVSAIRTLIEQVNEENLNARFYATEPENRLAPTMEIQLYRIVQEAVQNVLKHAHAKSLYVHLNRHKQHLNLMIEDDGIGMGPVLKPGLGLTNIKQRIKILNGTLSVDTSAQTGTTLTIQIPL